MMLPVLMKGTTTIKKNGIQPLCDDERDSMFKFELKLLFFNRITVVKIFFHEWEKQKQKTSFLKKHEST